mmetsp:Transcript_81554/g.162768  ORF Transcript_81554/g.162768 Transcript_81554/m.162768 type:complete len:96 (-) Transcript_81554:1654-1941(-)
MWRSAVRITNSRFLFSASTARYRCILIRISYNHRCFFASIALRKKHECGFGLLRFVIHVMVLVVAESFQAPLQLNMPCEHLNKRAFGAPPRCRAR